jgi:hypothetical protein
MGGQNVCSTSALIPRLDQVRGPAFIVEAKKRHANRSLQAFCTAPLALSAQEC